MTEGATWSPDLFGRLQSPGSGVEDFNAAIATQAIAFGVVLVTANLKHMARVPGLEVEHWS